jgi:hypothetical protein
MASPDSPLPEPASPLPSPDSEPPAEQDPMDALEASGCYTLHKELALDQIFTGREARLVKQIQDFCRGRSDDISRDIRQVMAVGLHGLGGIATALDAYPSLRDTVRLGGVERSGETLMRKLLQAGEHGLEWSLPTKALLSRTFGIAKVNFWSAVSFAVQRADEAEGSALLRQIKAAVEEAVYTRLAEELYASFVTSIVTPPQVKRLAINQIMDLWDGRIGFATDRFCPILRSAWHARCRAPRVFGTLMGTQEIAILLFQDCDERFVESFTQRDFNSQEVQAFEEFVFDLPFEDLERVRQMMDEEGRAAVGPEEVAKYLGYPKGRLNPLLEDPKALYTSFRKRRVKAQYRTSMRAPGPKRTAESYVLEGLLLAGDSEESVLPQ